MHLQHLSVPRKHVASLLVGTLLLAQGGTASAAPLVALGSFVALIAPSASAD